MPTPSQESPVSSTTSNEDLKDMNLFEPSKPKWRAKNWHMGVSKTSDHIQIKIMMPNPSQEPPVSSKAPNKDLKDMNVLCTFKIKTESQSLECGCKKPVKISKLRSRWQTSPRNFHSPSVPQSRFKWHFYGKSFVMVNLWFGRNLQKVSVPLPCENPFLF